MNTANLQLEGMIVLMASLFRSLQEIGALSPREINSLLDRAEADAGAEARREQGLTDAQVEAITFPIRFVRTALSGSSTSFSETAKRVGIAKDL